MLKYTAAAARAWILLFAALLAHPAWAANPVATSNAFDALLSLPQAQPEEGEWNHVVPKGFGAEDESGLIRWLALQKKAGADFNQVRHQGTLLHHAIRGGLETTARWLLAHGADPLKVLEGGDQQPDALALSIQYRRWEVANVLLNIPAVSAHGRAPQLLLAWQAAQGKDELAVIDKLLARRLPFPRGEASARLLGFALERQWLKVALALLDAGVTRAAPGAYGWGAPNKIGAAADIESADARLVAPIFPYLLAHVTSARDVESLWRLRIRRPFDDAAFTRQVVLLILAAPSTPPVKRALLERLPAKALKTAFNNGEVIDRWVRWSAQLTTAEGDWAFSALGDIPAQRPAVLLDAMLKNATWFDEHGPHANELAAGWARLLAGLPALPAESHGKLWMFVPRQHRPILLRMGYRPGDKELAHWLERDNKEAIRTLWPQLKAAVPGLAERIHEPLLAPYNPENGYTCNWGGVRQETLDKARVLLEAGATPRKPVVLDAGCVAITEPAILQSLKTAGLIEFQAPSSAEMRRFIVETPACRFNANAVWRRGLIKHRSLGDIPIDGMQVIAIPGEADCALLVWGGNAGGRVFIDDDSFTGTHRLTPCADGRHAAAIWRVTGDILQQTELGEDMPAIQGALPLRDTVSGEHFLLVGQIGTGTCGTSTPREVLSWHNSQDATARLRVLPRKSATMQAFLRQCGMPADAKTQDCFLSANDEADPNFNFIDKHWASDRKAYIDAVLSLDYAALRSAQKAVLFPQWVAQAIDAVSKANMPVVDKRQRTAWLFRDPTLLAEAMQAYSGYETLTGLVAWLPREDWLPVIKALQGNNPMLDHLHGEAARQGKQALACRFATVLGRACRKVQREAD